VTYVGTNSAAGLLYAASLQRALSKVKKF